jgi:plastocyanin
MAINQLTTANTFQQWLTASQSLIAVANNLTDGGASSTFFANTNVQIGGDLTVTGNITLETVGYDNLEVSGDLNVVGNTTVNNIFASGAGFSQNANVKSGVTTFSVVNSGSGAYLFDQYSGNNPSIFLHPGQTVSFSINASGHPFLIRQTNGGTLYNIGLTHVSTTGVVTTESGAQGKVTGTLIWKVPFELAGNTYVYQCQNHSGMVGNLVIQQTVTSAFAAANNSTGDALAFAIALG